MFIEKIITLPARLLWGIKLHENVLQVMHFDVYFDKSWYVENYRFHKEIMII